MAKTTRSMTGSKTITKSAPAKTATRKPAAAATRPARGTVAAAAGALKNTKGNNARKVATKGVAVSRPAARVRKTRPEMRAAKAAATAATATEGETPAAPRKTRSTAMGLKKGSA